MISVPAEDIEMVELMRPVTEAIAEERHNGSSQATDATAARTSHGGAD